MQIMLLYNGEPSEALVNPCEEAVLSLQERLQGLA